MKEGFLRCHDCGAITQKGEDVGNHFLFPFYRGERRGRLMFFYRCNVVKDKIKPFHVKIV